MTFELARGRNLKVNYKDNRKFMFRNYLSDSCTLLVLRISAGQLSADSYTIV